jgi:hypothetical protein
MSRIRLLAQRAWAGAAVRLCAAAIAIGGSAVGAAATPAQAATQAPNIHPCCQLLPYVSLTGSPTFLYYWQSTTLTAC